MPMMMPKRLSLLVAFWMWCTRSVTATLLSLPLPSGSWIDTAQPQSIEVEEIRGEDNKFRLKAMLACQPGNYMSWKCDTIVFSRGDVLANDNGRFVRQDIYDKICALRRQVHEKKVADKSQPDDGNLSIRESLLLAFLPLPSGMVLGQKWKKKLTNMTQANTVLRDMLQEDEAKLKKLKEKLAAFKKKNGFDLSKDTDLEEMEALLEDL